MTFERVDIRVAERVLNVDGAAVALGARAFDVLLALAERSDRVVSKAELLDLAWPGVVVEENNLTVQISTLRRLLGHSAIVTVTGRGYRLALTPRLSSSKQERPAPTTELGGRLERRLAAIVQADVVAWPRLVARDATRATNAWRRIRVELIERTVPRFGGRLIELTAERVQLEFGSAVEAVAWSLNLQSLLTDWRLGAAADESQSVHMRIGIAVDDVIVDDGKLVGDGVNVAADLQQIAGHDEVLSTQKVRDFVKHKLDAGFVTLGERPMRRTQRAMQVFRVGAASRPPAGATGGSPLARVASLAVLPFDTSGPVDETYFGDGVTDEIIATLSLNRALFVIAHSSTLRFRGRGSDLAAVAEQLGVRYLVTGSVRRAGQQVRIHVSLIYAPDQRILWQERFDGSTEDLFGFQSDIASNVAAAIAPQVQDEEVARVRHRPTEHYGAYDCVLRALAGIYQLGTAEFDTAGDMLKRAIQLDPEYAQAHAHLAWWYSLRNGEGRASPAEDEGRLALEHAIHAMRLDGRDAWGLSVAGYLITLREKQHSRALEIYDQALTINPGCAAAWARSAATLSYMGRSEESLERVQRAMRLSPFDQHMFWHLTICGGACFVGRRYDEAAGWLGKALRLNPRFNGARRVQIAALVRTGELAEARELAQAVLAECPDFTVSEFGRWSPMQQPYLDDLLQGLRHAGLPD